MRFGIFTAMYQSEIIIYIWDRPLTSPSIYKRLSNSNDIEKSNRQKSKFNGHFAVPGSRFRVRTMKSSEVPGRLEQDAVRHHMLYGLGQVATWT